MDKRRSVQSSSSRPPLGENPKRINSASSCSRPRNPNTYEIECKENFSVGLDDAKKPGRSTEPNKHSSQPPVNPRVSVVSQASEDHNASKRTSQVSTASASTANSTENKLKSYIGPWQLGKTLGKGSSARVRLARHRATHKSVAVKIINKRTAFLSQAGSISRLDKLEQHEPQEEDDVRRLPITVEREIAIMKLIEHSNIIQILDVWENRNEM